MLVVDDLGMGGQEDVDCIFAPGHVPNQFTSTHIGHIPATGKTAEEIGEEETPDVLQQLGVVPPLQ